jgi:hypothetical protein
MLGCSRAALGSLSEAAHVFDADLLRGVIGELLEKLSPIRGTTEFNEIKGVLTLVDGSLLPALPKLVEAMWLLKSKLTQRQARFAALTLHPQAEPSEIENWERQKADLREQIEQLEHEWTGLKEQMKSTPHHLVWDELPEDQKFQRLAPSRKRLTDTVKLVAYRAETALTAIVREEMSHADEARALIRDLFLSDADLHPDEAAGVLTVRVHTLANPRSNRAIQHLLDELNAVEFNYPGTNLRLRYSLATPTSRDSNVPF